MPPPVFRFALSPNGYLHLGHAFSALLNFDLARASGGRLLLRIEDIDLTRCKPEFETAIYQDLAWLGIAWEEPVARHSINSLRGVWSIRVSRAAPRSQHWWRSGRRTRLGRAIPTVRRFIPARQNCFRPMGAPDCLNRGRPMLCGSIWRRPARAPAISAGPSTAKVPMAGTARGGRR